MNSRAKNKGCNVVLLLSDAESHPHEAVYTVQNKRKMVVPRPTAALVAWVGVTVRFKQIKPTVCVNVSHAGTNEATNFLRALTLMNAACTPPNARLCHTMYPQLEQHYHGLDIR